MDSLKIPKGSSSNSAGGGTKPAGSVPITVRFNAGEECIDDILQSFHNNSNTGSNNTGGGSTMSGGGGGGVGSGGGDSLSSSPSQHHQLQSQQNADEVNTRNNFLQGNFFNRKRSGSIEGAISPSSSGPNLIAALSASDASVGTWKLIKGKVSQTIEDIKSSKSSNQNLTSVLSKAEVSKQFQQSSQHEFDSDWETATTHSSVSEDISLGSLQQKGDSDSSLDSEQLESDIERSRLRRGLAHLKSKVKSRSAVHHHSRHNPKHHLPHSSQHHHHHSPPPLATAALSSATISTAFGTASISPITPKEDPTPSSMQRSTGDLTPTNLRHRKPDGQKTSPPMHSVSDIKIDKKKKKDKDAKEKDRDREKEKEKEKEREMEKSNLKSKIRGNIVSGKKEIEIESGVEMMEDTIPPIAALQQDYNLPSTSKGIGVLVEGDPRHPPHRIKQPIVTTYERRISEIDGACTMKPNYGVTRKRRFSFGKLMKAIWRLPLLSISGLVTVLLLPIPDFLRGVLSCLMGFALVDSLSPLLNDLIRVCLSSTGPEQCKFAIPDYSKMPICEIPAVEEHKTVKAYAGWMNEVNSYDPLNAHIKLSNSVYVKLTGTILRISTTLARIPKRAMWNETPIDVNSVQFIEHRTYNLLGCRVELLPLGLARKRYFNRKYPIQLIVKENIGLLTEPQKNSKSPSAVSSKEVLLQSSSDSNQISMQSQLLSETHKERTETNLDRDGDMDFANAILHGDLQTLQDKVNPQYDQKEDIIPSGDEVRILLFSRGDREKEDWYRRFIAASHGDVYDRDLKLPDVRLIDHADVEKARTEEAARNIPPNQEPAPSDNKNKEAETKTTSPLAPDSSGKPEDNKKTSVPVTENFKDVPDDMEIIHTPDDTFEGLLMTPCTARNPVDYIRFMVLYQKACRTKKIPVYSRPGVEPGSPQGKNRKV